MKPKILLAKYLDWAVLAILAIALIFVAVRSFLLKATTDEKLNEEISQYDRTVQKGMSDTSAQPQPPRDYLSELRNRFEHPAVLDPYRRNSFLTREDIPFPPLQLRVGAPHAIRFTSTRFTQVISGDEKVVRVDLAYDLPTGVSTVTFTPLEAGETTIRIQTDEELVHLFKISVRSTIRPPPPNSPINVVVIPRATLEIRKTLLPAMVLISFLPDDPKQPSRTVGFSNNAAVYRKPATASDAEYVQVGPLLVPLSRDQIDEIMVKFRGPEAPAAQPAQTTPTAPTGPAPSGPPVPEAVKEIQAPNSTEMERNEGKPASGSFVFLDQTVDEGESYIYKIVTLSAASEADVEPVPCKEPCVTEPVLVPPLVEFTVLAVTGDHAKLRVTRRDPDTGEWLAPQDFTVGVGMKIGGVVTITLPQIPGMPQRRTKKVDFSTGCILVGVLPAYQVAQYDKLQWRPLGGGNYTVVYRAKDVRDPQILYLTPRGALHFKSKENPSSVSPLTTEETGGTKVPIPGAGGFRGPALPGYLRE